MNFTITHEIRKALMRYTKGKIVITRAEYTEDSDWETLAIAYTAQDDNEYIVFIEDARTMSSQEIWEYIERGL